jgi:hypothetical protein
MGHDSGSAVGDASFARSSFKARIVGADFEMESVIVAMASVGAHPSTAAKTAGPQSTAASQR